MNVDATGSSTTASFPGLTGRGDLGRDAFLQLLVTQLRNQDPSNPITNENFIAQLAQFSSLEQLEQIRNALETLVQLQILPTGSSPRS